jgi:hypothetical protein
MKRIITSKLMRKCLILAVMIAGLVFVASSDRYAEPITAAPCCEGCSGGGDPSDADVICGTSCAYVDPTGGTVYQDCKQDCVYRAGLCYNRCVYCHSNSGPGGSCSSASDCPINYFCAADNTCHRY